MTTFLNLSHRSLCILYFHNFKLQFFLMTNDLNDHFPHSLRSSLAEVLKTIETIGTIFFPCLRTLQSPSRSTLSLARARRGRTSGVCLRLASVRPLRGRLVCFSVKIRRLRSLRSLHQRLWIFALFEDVSSHAEVLKTIGTIFFPLLAHLSRVDRRWAVDGPALLNQPQHSTPLHKGRGEQPRGLRGGGAFTSSRTSLPPLSPPVPAFSSFSASAARRCARC